MAHVLADARPRFNSYPTAIHTQYPPSSSKYHYAPATPAHTPATTPTKAHPSTYPYRQATNPSHTRVPSTSSRTPRTSSSVPVPRPSTSGTDSYPHSRKNSVSRPSAPADGYRPKRDDERYARQQQDAARQARLIAERDATLRRMEERQRQAQAQTWFEEGQRLAAEAARRQQDDERRRAEDKLRAEEKLRRAAQAQAEEERKLHARKHERGRSQTHNPADKKWYQGWFREKSRDARGRKDDRASDREQRERAKSEGRARDAMDARERIDKDRARNTQSPSSVAAAWQAYDKACTELMESKPTKGKPLSTNLTFYDIPWPVLGQANTFHDLTNQNIAAFLLSPHHSQGKSPRARLRAAILIWHPDKFAQKVLPRVAESHRPAVVAAVNVVARIVTELISAHGN
ncbi:hypothetical protein CTheo_5142 [Ceratobasidium theobromae]|uniref:Uncharacterized protein n=1 Tax=Ceratobasidium theobromae TaxID=1582974 RepID=A0A5N5QI59_9AGAM|nr:hypothetical protein CTheo_5142 [Ceratobasidium theobromae]